MDSMSSNKFCRSVTLYVDNSRWKSTSSMKENSCPTRFYKVFESFLRETDSFSFARSKIKHRSKTKVKIRHYFYRKYEPTNLDFHFDFRTILNSDKSSQDYVQLLIVRRFSEQFDKSEVVHWKEKQKTNDRFFSIERMFFVVFLSSIYQVTMAKFGFCDLFSCLFDWFSL